MDSALQGLCRRSSESGGGSLPAGLRRPRGLTQIETAIAVVVLAVGILGVFAAFAWSTQSTRNGAMMSEAVNHARHLVELVRVRNLAHPLVPDSSSGIQDGGSESWDTLKELDAFPFAQDMPADTGFKRKIQVARVSNDSSNYGHDIAEISVRVYWMENGKLKQVRLTAHHRQP